MKLKFFRAEKEWLIRQIPQGCERILSMLTEEDMKEIFVWLMIIKEKVDDIGDNIDIKEEQKGF